MAAASRIRSTLRSSTALAVALLAAAGPARGQAAADAAPPLGRPVTAEPVVVPLEFLDGRILVPVTIEGVGERTFILDTAAGGSVVFSGIRGALDPSEEQLRQDSVIGASGAIVMEYVRVPGLGLGTEHRDDLWMVVADLSEDVDGRPVHGILGVDVLARYDIEIDIPGGALRLFPRDGRLIADVEDRAIPFHSGAQEGFIQFTGSVAGQSAAAILDSGARRSIVNWHAARLAGVTPESEGLRTHEKGSRGIDGNRVASHWHHFDDLAVGDTPVPAGDIKIADLPVFRVMGVADGPVLLLGTDILEACALRVAYSAGRFVLCPDGAPTP